LAHHAGIAGLYSQSIHHFAEQSSAQVPQALWSYYVRHTIAANT